MTDNPRRISRKLAHLAFGLAITLYGVVGFPTVPGQCTN